MNSMYCWPYEELRVSKLDQAQAFLFETPWHSSVIKTTVEGAMLFEEAFSEDAEHSPAELLDLYSRVLSHTLGSPYSYILSRSQMGALPGADTPSSLVSQNFQSPQSLAAALKMSETHFPKEWTWDLDALLSIAQVPDTEFYSPLTLYSAFLRFFYLEATSKDKTMSLYKDLHTVCKTEANTQSALAYLISQNLRVTQRCEEILTTALVHAGKNEDRLRDFIQAEQGHDKIMSNALKAFPETALKDWTLKFNPATDALMDMFHGLADHCFMGFAFAICLFERPQFEKVHPVTKLLQEVSLDEAAKRYERHHTINETGAHDHIGYEMIADIPLLSKAEATKAVRFCEAFSVIMTSHSAALLKTILSSIS
ncbi:hypothetical protein D3C87_1108430 [compost metagenome]